MDWSDVGEWVSDNAGTGAKLIGSLLVGNVPSAVAAGVSMVSSATGETTPKNVLAALQNNQATVVTLQEIAVKEEAGIRAHIAEMWRLNLADKQNEHEQTQSTIRNGDNSESTLVRAVRPLHATVSLGAAIVYVFNRTNPDVIILSALLTLPFTYFGLREAGKYANLQVNK